MPGIGASTGEGVVFYVPEGEKYVYCEMSIEQWAKSVMDAAKMAELGDEDRLLLICQILKQADDAKIELRRKGYGWTGLDLLETVKLVPNDGR